MAVSQKAESPSDQLEVTALRAWLQVLQHCGNIPKTLVPPAGFGMTAQIVANHADGHVCSSSA
eukprot:9249633-Pyramimonas_sp.AAC.1